ncbi:S-layer homology domain-containing protein [Paenibacillus sp. F411]|uniref:S-layer homology domain-containing protein n=1 Tax=Paenibacillus sp. F411 TaxID=2820239 RepID=UPI003266F679
MHLGDDVELTVSAEASGDLSYQWYSNTVNDNQSGVEIVDATTDTYAPPTDVIGATYYYVAVTNTDVSHKGKQTATTYSIPVKVTVELAHEIPDPPVTPPVTPDPPVTPPVTPDPPVTPPVTPDPPVTPPVTPDPPVTPPVTPDPPVTPAPTAPDTGSAAPQVPAAPAELEIWVNGKAEKAGTFQTTETGGKKRTVVTLDAGKLESRLAAAGNGVSIKIPVQTDADEVVGEFNGQMIKAMEKQQAALVLQTKQASYTLPASRISIDEVSEQLGSGAALQDLQVQIKISQPEPDKLQALQSAADQGAWEWVAPPVEFSLSATHRGKTIEISQFNDYVERAIVIPEGTDLSRITTGVVVEEDGSVRHVPTRVIQENGVYFATMNSLSNSTYAIIWNPVRFQDASGHWAENAVNDMGSRMVISGVGHGRVAPDQDITRGELATILVRALGLKEQSNTVSFTDVNKNDGYSGSVATAASYQLIQGFQDGTFRPWEKVNREQAMTMISKAMVLTGLKGQQADASASLDSFIDADTVAAWAQSGVLDCLNAGIVNGRSGQKLAAKSPVTRAEAAQMVQKLLQQSRLIEQQP